MDHIHWKPSWVERTSAEKEPLVAEIHTRDTWIFDGGHSWTYPERLVRESFKFWRWTWDTRHYQREKQLKIVNNPPVHLAVYRLTSMREIRHYVRDLERECTQ